VLCCVVLCCVVCVCVCVVFMVVSFYFGQCFVLCTNNQTTTSTHKNLEDSWWFMFCAYELLFIVIVAINHREMCNTASNQVLF